MTSKVLTERQNPRVLTESLETNKDLNDETNLNMHTSTGNLKPGESSPRSESKPVYPKIETPAVIFMHTKKRASRLKNCAVCFALTLLVIGGLIAIAFALFWQNLIIGGAN